MVGRVAGLCVVGGSYYTANHRGTAEDDIHLHCLRDKACNMRRLPP